MAWIRIINGGATDTNYLLNTTSAVTNKVIDVSNVNTVTIAVNAVYTGGDYGYASLNVTVK